MKDRVYTFFKHSGEFALYGILFFLPISNALIETFFGIALFSFIVRKIIKPDFNNFKFWPNLILLLFFIFIGLSLLNSGEYLHKSLWAWIAKWGQYLGICFIVQDTVSRREVLKRAIMVFLASAALVVISGFTQYFFGVEFLRGRALAHLGDRFCAVTSSFSHYNSLGVYIVVVIPVIMLLFISELKKNNRIAYSLGAFLFMSFLTDIFTFSRGSWVGLASFFVLLLLLLRDRTERRIVILAVVFFAFCAIFISYFTLYNNANLLTAYNVLGSPSERFLSIFQPGGDSDRLRYWQVALRMVRENPYFGKGAGVFMDYFSKYLPGVNISYAHNCYLQIFAETGFFSLFSFLFYIASLFYLSVKSFAKGKNYLLLGFLGGYFAYLVHAFFDSSLYSLPLAMLFWVWAGLISALIRLDKANGGLI
jgi:O-antigen ligase